jgi:hypothetical protein
MLLASVAWFMAGGLVEALNNAIRYWSVVRLGVEQRNSSILYLVLAFRHDTVSGFAALIGYWISRWVVIWRLHRRISNKKFRISG